MTLESVSYMSLRAKRSNLMVREISSELAYACGIPLRRYAPRNDCF